MFHRGLIYVNEKLIENSFENGIAPNVSMVIYNVRI